MSLGKKDIVKNISTKAQIQTSLSSDILESFLKIIKLESGSNIVKLSNFGTFHTKCTPARMGRNPKTLEPFLITKRYKLLLKPSSTIKKALN